MNKIYFVRHGESQANIRHEISNRGLQYGLTFNGRNQANTLAQKLIDQGITKIYSSPVLRAVETSIILANALGVEYEVSDALREYDCGILEGKSDEASWQKWQFLHESWTIHKRFDERLEGGESFLDIQNRFLPFIESLTQQKQISDEKILCVSHGGIYRLMLPLILRNMDAEKVRSLGIDYTTCIVSEMTVNGLYCVEWNGNPVNPSTLIENTQSIQ